MNAEQGFFYEEVDPNEHIFEWKITTALKGIELVQLAALTTKGRNQSLACRLVTFWLSYVHEFDLYTEDRARYRFENGRGVWDAQQAIYDQEGIDATHRNLMEAEQALHNAELGQYAETRAVVERYNQGYKRGAVYSLKFHESPNPSPGDVHVRKEDLLTLHTANAMIRLCNYVPGTATPFTPPPPSWQDRNIILANTSNPDTYLHR